MKKTINKALLFCLTLAPFAAQSHEANSLPYGPFLSGITHPVLGFDHLLAMISVGMISAQIGGRAIWSVPTTFVVVMFIGGLIGINIEGLRGYEIGIAVSVLLLGSALAADKRISNNFAMIAVGVFAIFHGYAHGNEIPKAIDPLSFIIGFVISTGLIHLVGILLGYILNNFYKGILSRVLGIFIFILGITFIIRNYF